jgi:hypothetical protein
MPRILLVTSFFWPAFKASMKPLAPTASARSRAKCFHPSGSDPVKSFAAPIFVEGG